MPSIWKAFGKPKTEEYAFPNADELLIGDAPAAPEEDEEQPLEEAPDLLEELEAVDIPGEEAPSETKEPEPEVPSYASLHTEALLREAEEKAAAILEKARLEADVLRETAHQEGYDAGYAEGIEEGQSTAEEEVSEQLERLHAQEQELADQTAEILTRASDAVDKRLDQCVPELRDLAIAVAEKVIGISLNTSSEVIERMIRMAVDKRKRREWVQIYVSGADAKRLTPISPLLSATLDALSDHVRIVPISDDETGVCIVEMPDEIVDASVSTQLNIMRTMLGDIPADPM